MRDWIVFCLLGAIGGALLVTSTHSFWHQTSRLEISEKKDKRIAGTASSSIESRQDRLATASKREELTADASKQEPKVAPEIVTDQSAAPEALSGGNDGAPVDQTGREIPENYEAMVRPRPLPEKLTTQEMYEEFVSDSRDESWAYPMELGIGQYIAERGSEFGAAFEFVECRSRYCTIAGVVYGGGQPTVNEMMAEMTGRGWWQTYGGANTVGSRTDDEYRFVSIFPRTPGDFSRDSSGQSVGKKEDSNLKSVGG